MIHDLTKIKETRVKDLQDTIFKLKSTKISDLKVVDLAFCSNQPRVSGHGVYIFTNNKQKVIYVGKTTSRSFVERIPAHFSSTGWFGTLWKLMVENNKDKSTQEIVKIIAATNFVGIEFGSTVESKVMAQNLEKLLQGHLDPIFNKVRKKHRDIATNSLEMRIKDALQSESFN